MIVKCEMNVSAEEYFDFLLKSLLEELQKDFKKKLTKKDIKQGLSYKRTYKFPKGDFVSEKTIDQYEYGVVYGLRMEIPNGEQFLRHHIEKIDDENIVVTYEESIETRSFLTNITYKLRSNKYKKGMVQRFYAIEEEIKKNRK